MIKTETVEYKEGGTTLEGHVVYDDSTSGRRPGVMVVPEWYGINKFTLNRCEALAAMGYVAFATDVYGRGIRPAGFEAAQSTSKPYYEDRALLRRRGRAGIEALVARREADPAKIAGIGYCFGGITLLEMARDGIEMAGIVCFHSQLETPMPAKQPDAIKTRILVLHGAYDPVVPQNEIDDFIVEMRTCKVDWQLISYGNAVHSYTNPDWPQDPSHTKAAAYHPLTDRRSWLHMSDFFAEIF